MAYLLHEAAFSGNMNEVRRMILESRHEWQCQVSINSRISSSLFINLRNTVRGGTTALHAASYGGHLNVVQCLIEEGQGDVHCGDLLEDGGKGGWTALHYACHHGNHVETVRYLLEVCGANIEKQDEDGNTPLHIACLADSNTETVRYLVEEQQANLDAKTRHGMTPIHLTVLKRGSSAEDVVQCLLPRVSSIDARTLRMAFMYRFGWDTMILALEKYAMGMNLAHAFRTYPIHTILQFPLPSTTCFQESINHYYRASPGSSFADDQGRLLIHVALTSPSALVRSPLIILSLFEHEPNSSIMRNPTTGLFAHETAGLIASDNERDWLGVVYELFRSNPTQLLCSRGLAKTSESNDPFVIESVGEPSRKRTRTTYKRR